jgi:non-specific serine/threonine protein kinase/serine/threonine-protein kinase
MDAGRWERVKEIFSGALERDAAARAAFLDEACTGDTALRVEVDSLLASHEADDDFIERPAAHRALGIKPEIEPPSWIGRRCGDYRIVEEVGRGGMSEVYKAVRDDDEYHKEVAVKVLRRGYDTKALLKRFKVETQILATLDHPNIARLLDAGSTEEGLPYLVMDFIQGRTIDDYCRHRKLALGARLELFRQLCKAVQYVHQHLMVHGDLKCNNVLVSENGTVKLLDFGIARLLQPLASPAGVLDAKLTALMALTPEYASPEQIRGGPITTASDVYSLGVMLYQLVTGTLPHRLRGNSSFELAAQIMTQDALPPSVASKTSSTTDTTGFGRALRGDLDNIILMALEKDPARRYSSVEKFEEDLRKHLEGFPVSARSAGYLYQLGKFAGRHKAGIAAVAIIGITLIGGIFTTLRQAQIAWDERQRAQRHFDEVRKLANVFMFDVHGAIQDLPGSTPARQMLVENSLKYLAVLSAESASEPSLQRELASAYEKVADVQGGFRIANLGDTTGAISSYRKALALREQLAAADSQDREVRRDLLRNHGKLSEILSGEGDTAAAIESSRRATKLAQQLAGLPGATVEDRRNVATALLSLGWQLARARQVGDGVLFIRQSIAIFEAMRTERPEDGVIQRNLSLAYGRLGETLLNNTELYEDALVANRHSYDIVSKMLAEDPHNTRLGKIVAYAELGMASALTHLKQPRAALAEQVKAVEVFREMLNADSKNEVARYDAAFALSESGATLITLGELTPAEARLTEALGVLSHAPGIIAATLNDSKVLLGIDYYRLGLLHAARVSQLGPGDQRKGCEEADKWFALGEPIVSLASTAEDLEWRTLSKGAMDRRNQEAGTCAKVLTAAK